MRTILLVLSTAAFACSSGPAPEPTSRPEGVPATARLMDGPDHTRVWVACSKKPAEVSRFDCTVWDELQGKVWTSGEFELQRPTKDLATGEKRYVKATITPYPFTILSFDGEKLLVSESYRMVPVRD